MSDRIPMTAVLTLVALFVWTGLADPVRAQSPSARVSHPPTESSPGPLSPADRVDEIMAEYGAGMPGGVVAVTRGGEVVFARGYGEANLEYGIPNSPTTPWHMASVSKQFTAFALLMLEAEGRLSIDDDVRSHIPELHDFGETITIRHLLNHTSGLRDQWTLWVMSGGRMDDVIRQEDLLGLALRQRELNFPPGSEYLYSNTGYLLAAEVVARVTGQPFGDWMRANVFEPLGMHDTQIYDDHQRVVPGRAYSYRAVPRDDDRDEDVNGAHAGPRFSKAVLSYANSGATSLFTTAHDLARWLRNYRTGEVGGPVVLERLRERGRLTTGDTIEYALGVFVGEHRGLRRIAHGGADAGYRTNLAYFPDLDAGVIVLGNIASFNAGNVANRVAEAFFEAEMEPEEVLAAEASREDAREEDGAGAGSALSPEPLEPSRAELAAYTGRYYSAELETAYDLAVSDRQLVARHPRHGDLALTATAEPDRFRNDAWFFSDVEFQRDDDGRVSGMRVTSGRVRGLWFRRAEAPAPRLTWLSVSNWLLEVGDTRILLDAYITRVDPSLLTADGLSPRAARSDTARVRRLLEPAVPDLRLDAVLVGHGHWDHAFDVPSVARLTGARVVGARTVCHQVAALAPDAPCRPVEGGEVLRFGEDVRVRVVRWAHSGDLVTPLGRRGVPLELRGPPTPDPATGGLRPGFLQDFPNGGGARGFLITVDTDDGPFTILTTNTANPDGWDRVLPADMEALVDAGVDVSNLEPAPADRPTREALAAALQAEGIDRVDVWLGFPTPAHVEQVVEVLRPRLFVPHHWDAFVDHELEEGPGDAFDPSALTPILEEAGVELWVPERYYQTLPTGR